MHPTTFLGDTMNSKHGRSSELGGNEGGAAAEGLYGYVGDSTEGGRPQAASICGYVAMWLCGSVACTYVAMWLYGYVLLCTWHCPVSTVLHTVRTHRRNAQDALQMQNWRKEARHA